MENSALRSVFGSSASLAELSGDTQPTARPPSGYSRFGLNERPPSHQMHTKARRNSMPPLPKNQASKRRFPVWLTVVALSLFGVLQASLIDFHTPFFLEKTKGSAAVSFIVFILLSVTSGLAISETDVQHDSEPANSSAGLGEIASGPKRPTHRHSSSAGRIRPTDLANSAPNQWFQSMLRGYGILLGLIYLSEQLPGDAEKAWVLIAPTVWAVSDGTLNGFYVSAAAASLSSLLGFFLLPEMQASTGVTPYGILHTLAGTCTTYFATAIMAGTLGRAMR